MTGLPSLLAALGLVGVVFALLSFLLRDGVDGCRAIQASGGFVLGQDEATSAVYGMNSVAFAEGHVDRQFSINDAASIMKFQTQRLMSKKKLVKH